MPRSWGGQQAYSARLKAQRRSGVRIYREGLSNTLNGVKSEVVLEMENNTRRFTRALVAEAKSRLERNDSIVTGLLRKAIAAKTKVYKWRQGVDGEGRPLFSTAVWGALGVDRSVEGYDDNNNHIWPTKYAHLVEYGHARGKNKRGGNVDEKPFMRQALAHLGGAQAIQEIFVDAWRKVLG